MGNKRWMGVAMTAGLICHGADAQEQVRVRVISAIPVMQQVAVSHPLCEDEEVYTGQRVTGVGAIAGAIIGGLAGNALGYGGRHGHYYGYYQPPARGTNTVVGAIAGGLIGHSIESANSQAHFETVRRCTNTSRYENRVIGYDVSYEHAGQRYSTRMDYDPGPWFNVMVQPKGRYVSSTASTRITYTGPHGVYQSAPTGVPVITNIVEYSAAPAPMLIGTNVSELPRSGYHPTPHAR